MAKRNKHAKCTECGGEYALTDFHNCPVVNGRLQASAETKREHFAAIAMQGLLSNPAIFQPNDFKEVADGIRGGARIAKVAEIHADALLKALEEV